MNRLNSIDHFRGFAILGMVIANFLAGANNIPAWSKHAPDIGLTWVDLVAPFFIFAIGLTYHPSFQHRLAAAGWSATVRHFVRRWLSLLALGYLLVIAEGWFIPLGSPINWGVLQAIGLAGLICLPTLSLPGWARALLGIALLGGYQFLLQHGWLAVVLASPHGGIQAGLSWAAMLLLATALADVFHDVNKGRKWFPVLTGLVLAVGIALTFLIPISKNRVSASYVIISLGVSALVFWLFHLLTDRLKRPLPVLSTWGRNPLALYLLHMVVLAVFVLPPIPAWFVEAPTGQVLLECAVFIAILTGLGIWLEKRGWFLTI